MLSDLSSAHLRICRSNFDNRRSANGDISETISELSGFLSVWFDSSEENTVSRVISYLRAIQNGVSGYFTITSGYFPNIPRSFDTPDIRVTASGAVSISTPVIDNQERSSFGYGASLTWRPNMSPINIRAYEVDTVGSDAEVLNVTIYASGWNGIRNLDGTYRSNGNSISVSFIASVPSCPW